ncbi:hypothetical protein ACFLVG_00740 [Chloroflexota bacterium]
MMKLVMAWFFRGFDACHVPRLFEFIWHILTKVSALSETEINAASSVLGASAIRYSAVRIAEGGLLWFIFRLNKKRAFTTFHTINLPVSGANSRSHLDIIVHELIHVYQFELAGSIYIWQALQAQRATGYRYGGWRQLEEDWNNGKHFHDYNREQQGQIAQDYYNEVIVKELSDEDPVCHAYKPFIGELRNRVL